MTKQTKMGKTFQRILDAQHNDMCVKLPSLDDFVIINRRNTGSFHARCDTCHKYFVPGHKVYAFCFQSGASGCRMVQMCSVCYHDLRVLLKLDPFVNVTSAYKEAIGKLIDTLKATKERRENGLD